MWDWKIKIDVWRGWFDTQPWTFSEREMEMNKFPMNSCWIYYYSEDEIEEFCGGVGGYEVLIKILIDNFQNFRR